MNAKTLKEVIESLETIKTGIDTLINVLSSADTKTEKEPAKKEAKAKVEEEVNPPAEEVEGTEETTVDLDSMKYSDLKKLASDLGVKAVGTRKELISRIEKAQAERNSVEEESEQEEEKEETPKSDKSGKSKRVGNKKVEEPAESEPEESEEEDSEDDFLKQAKEIAEDTDLEDIIETLKEAGIKRVTKKNAVDKLAEALKEGIIELEAEDEEEEDEELPFSDDSDENDGEEVDENTYFEDYDLEATNNPEDMTKKRKKACVALQKTILDDYENEELTDGDVDEFLSDFATEAEMDNIDYTSADDKLMLFIEIHKRFIDDDGEEVEAGEPYEINGHNMCCGHTLKYDKKTKQYICEVCGEEYEVED